MTFRSFPPMVACGVVLAAIIVVSANAGTGEKDDRELLQPERRRLPRDLRAQPGDLAADLDRRALLLAIHAVCSPFGYWRERPSALREAVRLLTFKAGGSFLVHDDAGGFRLLNWIRREFRPEGD